MMFVCTDSHKIKEVVEKHNGKYLLTKKVEMEQKELLK